MVSANEINSIKELLNRLKKLYFYEDLISGEFYTTHRTRCKNYFKVTNLKNKGLSCAQIAKKLRLDYNKVRNNLICKPYLILLAESVPNIKIKKRNKLLPLHSKQGGHTYNSYIEVSLKINSYKEITYVINQLGKNNSNHKLKEKALAYILGMMVSDSSKPKGYRFSNQFLLALTKKYDWSLKIGNFTSKNFNYLGIKAKRIKDYNKIEKRRPFGLYRWISEKSPFIKFLIKTCLGLKENEGTTYNNVRMNWLLDCPTKFLISFLQGVCDGDGSAHNFWRVEIACDPNKELFIKILKKLKIHSYPDGDAVSVSNEESILNALKINIFLKAEGRKRKLKRLAKMIKKRVLIRDLNPKIRNKLIILRRKGMTGGEISDYMFDKLGIGIAPYSLYKLPKK